MGFWEFGGEGWVGGRVGQMGSVYQQPGTEVDIPVTAGGRQVSRRETKEVKGE